MQKIQLSKFGKYIAKSREVKARLEATPSHLAEIETPLGYLSAENLNWLLGDDPIHYPLSDIFPDTKYMRARDEFDNPDRYGDYVLLGSFSDLSPRLDCAQYRIPGLRANDKITFIRRGSFRNVKLDFENYLTQQKGKKGPKTKHI